MALVLPVLVCLASGFLLVSLGWSRKAPLASDLILTVSLSAGYGLGVFSVIFLLARVCHVGNLMAVDLLFFALLTAAVVLVARASRASPGLTGSETRSHTSAAWLHRVLTGAFVIALCAALYSTVLRLRAYPRGDGWDAFAIWNLHARFLFRGGAAHWCDGFTSLIPWSHPDYPLLLPASIAHFWIYLGRDDPRVPASIGFCFTFATVGVLCSALSILRGRAQAMLGAIALLATPSFIEQGAWQYADIPLSFFYLATIVLLCLHDQGTQEASSQPPAGLLALGGVAAGFAAWTKNEGVLFLGAIILARQLTSLRDPRRASLQGAKIAFARHSGLLLAGSAPVFLLLIYFKHWIAPPGDLFSDPSSMLHKVLNLTRYGAIIKWYVKDFFRFGDWLLIPGSLLVVGLFFVAGKEDRGAARPGFRTSVLALSLTLAGYFAVYLITPYDIYWHLRFSLGRLFLQLWPATVFLFFLAVQGLPGNSRSEVDN
jgi:hypothetical protein